MSIILDLSPTEWHLSSLPKNPYPLTFKSFLSQTLAFLNSHLALKHENTLAVYGAFPGKSVLLYSSTDHKTDAADDSLADPNTYLPFKIVDTVVTKRIGEELDAMSDQEEEDINRLVNPGTTNVTTDVPPTPPEPRIVILSVSPDLSTSYIPLMNSIFSAQKLKVAIDVCKIYGPDAVFLQQAAHLTGGSYIYLERRDAFLQHLLMTFLPTPSMRKLIAVPTQDRIDFRAACFCHKTIVDIGFVCSVCLSIFCHPVPVCSTCRTKFPIKSLQRLNASRPSGIGTTPPPRGGTQSGARTPALGSVGGGGGGAGTPGPAATGARPLASTASVTMGVGSMNLGLPAPGQNNIRANGTSVTPPAPVNGAGTGPRAGLGSVSISSTPRRRNSEQPAMGCGGEERIASRDATERDGVRKSQ
ncbi:Tfb4-domain-containing protein [Sanghuangporus baumii]|uniref:General transcription and DNA repair factor IIH subunit TFB4 n=1 Tax=Sanghuangporus baumii TaxID=108892 RepID=A0A9Q5I0S5_SANBA|nr:Tfb4-domain-containing protein [Sanghuangporus baumii]